MNNQVHRLLSPNDTIRMVDNKIYEVIQSCEFLAVQTSSATVPTSVAIPIALTNFDQYAAFTSVFDQFRIVEIEYTFRPRIQTMDGTITNSGLFHTVVDYDDANTLLSAAAALDYSNCLVTQGNREHKRRFKPHVAIAAYANLLTFNYANVADLWIETASNIVTYYGVKTVWTPTSVALNMDLTVRARIQFKNVR